MAVLGIKLIYFYREKKHASDDKENLVENEGWERK